MARMTLRALIGEIPRYLPRYLPQNAAVDAQNVRLTDGGLEPIRQTDLIETLDPAPGVTNATIYRHLGEWLSWDAFVKAVPGPVADDRLYIFGDGVPKLYEDSTERDLALEPPASALSGSVSGTGTGDTIDLSYVYTFVTDLGEESAPSPLSGLIPWKDGETVTLTGFAVGDSTRGVDTQRIYRTQDGPGGTDLYFIAERATTTSDYNDVVDLTDFGEVLATLDWTTPPDDLEGAVAMPNGMMAAFSGKDLYFCEPYFIHAWPVKYVLTVDYDIVALGVFGNTVVILTEGTPYLAQGNHPAEMIMERLELALPCINKRGVVDLGYSVAYPTHDGLAVISSGGARLATEQLFSREDWQAVNPVGFAAGQYDGRYFASYSYIDAITGELEEGTFIIDLSGEQPFLIRTSVLTESFYCELETGSLFYLLDGTVRQWDAPGKVRTTMTWRSGDRVLPKPTHFSAIYIAARDALTDAEIEAIEALAAIIGAQNEALVSSGNIGSAVNAFAVNALPVNGDLLQMVPTVDQEVSVNIYVEDVLKETVTGVNEMKRLKGGYRGRRFAIEVTGNTWIEQIDLATSGRELESV